MTPTVAQTLWRQPMVFVAALLGGALAAESRHTFVASAVAAAAAAQAEQLPVVTLTRPQAVAADEGASPADSLVADDLPNGSADALSRGHSARRPGALVILPRQVKRLAPISPKKRFAGDASGQSAAQSDRPAGQVMRLPQVVTDRLSLSPEVPPRGKTAPIRLPTVGFAMIQSDQSGEVDPIADAELRPQSSLDFSLPGGGLNIRQLAPTRFVAPLPLAIPEARNVPRR